MTPSQQRTRLYIDNPWDEVERQIIEIATVELCDPEDGPSAREWAAETATTIARRVMQTLDGSEYEAEKHGLRKLA